MGKIIDGIVSAALLVGMAAGGQYALKRGFLAARKAALTKAAQGLPPLSPFARNLAKSQSRSSSKDSHTTIPSP